MLINCPRCGLSQPNDQYCAQCGVDMQAFKPKEKPLLNRVFSNAGVQTGILLIAAVLVGQYIFHSREQHSWVQKITHFQGMSKSERAKAPNQTANRLSPAEAEGAPIETNSPAAATQLNSLQDRERSAGKAGELGGATVATASAAIPNTTGAQNTQSGAQDLSSMRFMLTYAEVPRDVLAKWISESSNLGLYQNLEEYSAGIIYDFKKRSENNHQKLKYADIKLGTGTSNSNLSGFMSEDGTQILGFITSVEYKSNENEITHGNINITKSSTQGTESYPAEFALPKGAAFFIVGALKTTNFASERSKLTMPPFQVFKSPDFMTRKTEFVIILEPDYK